METIESGFGGSVHDGVPASKYLNEAIFGLFGDIFTLNADYIAWKLLKMALEVQYMMEYQHPVCLTLAIIFQVTLGLPKWYLLLHIYKTVRPYTSFIIGCITYWFMLIISRWPAGQEIMYAIGP